MLTAEMYARVRALMCDCGENCENCEILERARAETDPRDEPVLAPLCTAFVIKYPAEAVKITHLWWEKNKERYGKFQL